MKVCSNTTGVASYLPDSFRAKLMTVVESSRVGVWFCRKRTVSGRASPRFTVTDCISLLSVWLVTSLRVSSSTNNSIEKSEVSKVSAKYTLAILRFLHLQAKPPFAAAILQALSAKMFVFFEGLTDPPPRHRHQ